MVEDEVLPAAEIGPIRANARRRERDLPETTKKDRVNQRADLSKPVEIQAPVHVELVQSLLRKGREPARAPNGAVLTDHLHGRNLLNSATSRETSGSVRKVVLQKQPLRSRQQEMRERPIGGAPPGLRERREVRDQAPGHLKNLPRVAKVNAVPASAARPLASPIKKFTKADLSAPELQYGSAGLKKVPSNPTKSGSINSLLTAEFHPGVKRTS